GKSEVKKNTQILIMLAGPLYEFRTRINAAHAIETLNLLDEDVVKNLVDAILSYNYRLSSPCQEVLKTLCKDKKHSKAFNKVFDKLNPDQKAILKLKGIVSL